MIKNILLVLLLIVNQTTWADCPQDIQEVHKGDIVECDGIFVSPEAARKIDQQQLDLRYYRDLSDKLTKRNELTDKQLDTLDQRLKLYQDQSNELASRLTQKEGNDKWERIGYFALGVIATGLAVYGASQLR